jgi:non-heme chloroperoxidase
MLRRILIAAGVLVLAMVAGFTAVIAFNSPTAPPVLAAGNSIPGIQQWNFAELPKVQTVKARDGAPLNYRLYPGRPGRAVVLVHGSSGIDASMLKLAQALQAAGASVYAISLRGHGGSGTSNGDVSYIGQLDDDLADLVKGVGLDKPGMHRTLAGFSSGGGLVLRIAGGPQASLFDDYLAISPYIAQDSPTNKPNSGGWAGGALPRIVALSLLNGFGLPWFQGLPAVHFATAAKADSNRTPVYSFRLATSLQLGRD